MPPRWSTHMRNVEVLCARRSCYSVPCVVELARYGVLKFIHLSPVNTPETRWSIILQVQFSKGACANLCSLGWYLSLLQLDPRELRERPERPSEEGFLAPTSRARGGSIERSTMYWRWFSALCSMTHPIGSSVPASTGIVCGRTTTACSCAGVTRRHSTQSVTRAPTPACVRSSSKGLAG